MTNQNINSKNTLKKITQSENKQNKTKYLNEQKNDNKQNMQGT